MLSRVCGAAGGSGGLWRAAASATEAVRGAVGSRGLATAVATNNDRPLAGDAAVREAARQQPGSLAEPPLLHDSLSGADYGYTARHRSAGVVRMSSITEPDYYLHNSLSEGTYDMPQVLQRTASLNPRRGQGFSTAKHRPTMQRIIVANRAAPLDTPLHDSYSEIDYAPRYKQ